MAPRSNRVNPGGWGNQPDASMLGEGTHPATFLRALQAGETLATAMTQASAETVAFDLTANLKGLIAARIVAKIDP